MERCKQLIEELKEQLQVSVQGEGKMRRMSEESQSELQEWKGRHQMLTEQVRKLVAPDGLQKCALEKVYFLG